MKWVESYLAEVGRHLSADARDDILSELRDALEEQIEEQAGDEPVTDALQKAVITRFGRPMTVASRYDGPRYLIGPTLFPLFWQTLRTVLIVVALIQCALVLTAYVVSGGVTNVIRLLTGVFDTLLWSSVVVVAIFAAIEASGVQSWRDDTWSAASLSPGQGRPISRGDLITNLVSEAVFLLWWNGALPLTDWLPAEVVAFELAPVWSALYWPLNLLFLAWLLLHAWVLIRGLWQRATLLAEIALGAVGLAIGAYILTQAPLLVVTGSLAEINGPIAHRVLFTAVLVVCGFIAWDVALAVGRLRRGARGDDRGASATLT